MKCYYCDSDTNKIDHEDFDERFDEKGNKAAAGRARKAIGSIKKLVTEYRQASVDETRY